MKAMQNARKLIEILCVAFFYAVLLGNLFFPIPQCCCTPFHVFFCVLFHFFVLFSSVLCIRRIARWKYRPRIKCIHKNAEAENQLMGMAESPTHQFDGVHTHNIYFLRNMVEKWEHACTYEHATDATLLCHSSSNEEMCIRLLLCRHCVN